MPNVAKKYSNEINSRDNKRFSQGVYDFCRLRGISLKNGNIKLDVNEQLLQILSTENEFRSYMSKIKQQVDGYQLKDDFVRFMTREIQKKVRDGLIKSSSPISLSEIQKLKKDVELGLKDLTNYAYYGKRCIQVLYKELEKVELSLKKKGYKKNIIAHRSLIEDLEKAQKTKRVDIMIKCINRVTDGIGDLYNKYQIDVQ